MVRKCRLPCCLIFCFTSWCQHTLVIVMQKVIGLSIRSHMQWLMMNASDVSLATTMCGALNVLCMDRGHKRRSLMNPYNYQNDSYGDGEDFHDTNGSAEEQILQELQAVAEGEASSVYQSSTSLKFVLSSCKMNEQLTAEVNEDGELHESDLAPQNSVTQIIKNNDLEELWELVSGTSGTISWELESYIVKVKFMSSMPTFKYKIKEFKYKCNKFKFKFKKFKYKIKRFKKNIKKFKY